MSYVMRALSVSGNYISWTSHLVDFSGINAPEAMQPGTAVVVLEKDGLSKILSLDEATTDGYNIIINDESVLKFEKLTSLPTSPGSNYNYFGLGSDGYLYSVTDTFTQGLVGVLYPISVSDNAVVRFNSTTGKLIQNSQVIIDDDGNLSLTTIDAELRLAGNDGYYTGFKATNADLESNIIYTLPYADGVSGNILSTNGSGELSWQSHYPINPIEGYVLSYVAGDYTWVQQSSTNLDGYVVGPNLSTDNAVARYDLTTGKLIKNSSITINDDGDLSLTTANAELRLYDNAGTGYVAVKGPANMYESNIILTLPDSDGSLNDVLISDGSGNLSWQGAHVIGPASATDNAVARYNLTTGKLIQNSSVTIDDNGNLTVNGTINGYSFPLGWGSTLDVSNTSDGYTVNLTAGSILSSINQNITIDPQDGYAVNIGDTSSSVLMSTSETAVTFYRDVILYSDAYEISAPAGENLNIILPPNYDILYPGGNIELTAGDGYVIGGAVQFYGGDNISGGPGGDIIGYGGDTSSVGDNGGQVLFVGGTSTNGYGGHVNLQGGSGETGGNVNLQMGNGTTTEGSINFIYSDGTIVASFIGANLVGNNTLNLIGKADSVSPGGVIVQAGECNGATGNGGSCTILGGSAAGDGYTGGSVSVQAGASTLGTGGTIYIYAASGETGGNVVLAPGDGSASDGQIQFQHVNGSTSVYLDTSSNIFFGGTNSGGNISVRGGFATTGIDGGNVYVIGGQSSTDGSLDGGDVVITGGMTAVSGRNGGNVTITSGASNTSGEAGSISISGEGSNTGGSITIAAGSSYTTDGADIGIYGGKGFDGYGGDIIIKAGEGSEGYTGGTVIISGGDATWASCAFITVEGSNEALETGGDLILTAGAGTISGGHISILSGTGPVAGNISITSGAGTTYGNISINAIDGNITNNSDNIKSTTGSLIIEQDDGGGTDFGGHSGVLGYNSYYKKSIFPFVISASGALTAPINSREYIWSLDITDGSVQEFDIDITGIGGPSDGYRSFVVEYDILCAKTNGHTGSGCVYRKYIAAFVKDANNSLWTFGTNVEVASMYEVSVGWTVTTSAPDSTTLRLTIDPDTRPWRFLIRATLHCTGTYGA